MIGEIDFYGLSFHADLYFIIRKDGIAKIIVDLILLK